MELHESRGQEGKPPHSASTPSSPVAVDLDELIRRCNFELWPQAEAFAEVFTGVAAQAVAQFNAGTFTKEVRAELGTHLRTASKAFQEYAAEFLDSIAQKYGPLSIVPAEMILHSVRGGVFILNCFLETDTGAIQTPEAKAAVARHAERLTRDTLLRRTGLRVEVFRDALIAPHLRHSPSEKLVGGHEAPLPQVITGLLATHAKVIPGGEKLHLQVKGPSFHDSIPHRFIIHEILSECIANAMRAMSSLGEGTVGVRYSLRQNDRGHYWRFTVSDTGPGMSSEDFRKFSVGGFSTRPGGGQGFRLNRMAIEKILGGTWKFRNVPGKGVAVTFTVPVNEPGR